MKNNIEPELVKEIWKEGFSLENDVFVLLNKFKWRIDPNIFFEEKDGRIKDYDILALKKIQIHNTSLYFVLPIECKYNPYKVVFYTRTQKAPNIPCMLAIGENVKNIFNVQVIEAAFKTQKTFKRELFHEEEVFGMQSFDVKTNLVKVKDQGAKPIKQIKVEHKQENTEKMY